MKNLPITSASIATASFRTMLAILLVGWVAASTQAASIVQVTYFQNDKPVATGVYTGSAGGANSDPATYWALITRPPEIVSADLSITPDKKNGKVATLKGNIRLSLTIRSSISMGIIELDSLRLVRNDTKSKRWHVPKDEYPRIGNLVKTLKDTITVQYTKGYSRLAQFIYTRPEDTDASQPASFWSVLGSPPPVVDSVRFKPDTPNGTTVTLKGEIRIKLDPRPYTKLAGNTPYPGQVKLDSLQLVRDRADSDKWRLPKSEVQRVLALVSSAESKPPVAEPAH